MALRPVPREDPSGAEEKCSDEKKADEKDAEEKEERPRCP